MKAFGPESMAVMANLVMPVRKAKMDVTHVIFYGPVKVMQDCSVGLGKVLVQNMIGHRRIVLVNHDDGACAVLFGDSLKKIPQHLAVGLSE
jgi:hypothetical protein